MTADDLSEFMSNSTTQWFKPTSAFFAFFKELPWRYKRYFDVGAGVGQVTKSMQEQGFICAGFDIYPRDAAVTEIIPMDVLKKWLPMETFDVILLCRPCHGGFVPGVIDRYEDQGDIFYVGVERNVKEHLEGMIYEIVAYEVGEEGEALYRIWGQHHTAKTFALINQHGHESWWEQTATRYVTAAGGGFNREDNPYPIIKTQRAAHADMFYDDPVKTLKPDSREGWLAPDGMFYGCAYAAHASIAMHTLGVTEKTLENLGFLRLCDQFYSGSRYSRFPDRRLTKEQIAVLRRLKYGLRDRDDAHADVDRSL